LKSHNRRVAASIKEIGLTMTTNSIAKWQPVPAPQSNRTTGRIHLQRNPRSSSRLPELDALRGLMLVGIALTHLPTRVSHYSNQMLGFISWAEGFVLISALLAGRVYGALLRQWHLRTLVKKLWLRSAKLYGYHMALLGVAFTVIASIAVHTQEPALQGLLDFYLAHRALAAVSAALLLYCPPLLDILPMYIVFLLLTPILLAIGRRWGWKYVLAPSALLWFVAQFGLRGFLYAFLVRHAGFPIPEQNLGAFNLAAWQFLWVFGLWAGTEGSDRLLGWFRSRWTIGLSVLLAMMFFVLRYQLIPYFAAHPIDQGWTWVLFDKWQLGVLRLLNFAALAALFVAVRRYIARPLARTPLGLLGKHSLEVFCVHVFFCFVALSLIGSGTEAPALYQATILVIALSGMYAVAYLLSQRKKQASLAPGPVAMRSPYAAQAERAYRPRFVSFTLYFFVFLFTVFLR
jgi:hypothetical protein